MECAWLRVSLFVLDCLCVCVYVHLIGVVGCLDVCVCLIPCVSLACALVGLFASSFYVI